MQAVGMVGKKMVLYPLGELMERLGFSEGCEVVFRVEGVGFVVERVESLWELALRSRKWAETSVEEFERESEEEQGRSVLGRSRVVLDATCILPSLGASVREVEDTRAIMEYGKDVECFYPSPLLAELLAKVAEEASKRGSPSFRLRLVRGLRALLAGLTVRVENPPVDSLVLAAELWIRGH